MIDRSTIRKHEAVARKPSLSFKELIQRVDRSSFQLLGRPSETAGGIGGKDLAQHLRPFDSEAENDLSHVARI